MKKFLASIFCCGMIFFLVTGCGKGSAGKNDVFKYMEQLSANNSIEEMNKIIGSEGNLKKETDSYKIYSWDLGDDISISVQVSSSDKKTITASIPKKLFKKNADFSKWSEIKSKLNTKDSLTYDEFVKLVGGVEGVITQKSDDSVTYEWVNADGGYLNAYFDIDTNKCTMATGRF